MSLSSYLSSTKFLTMKKLIYILSLIFLLASCDQVVFPEPQPRKVKALKEIPALLQGTYLDHNDDSLYVNENSFSFSESGLVSAWDECLSDSAVLKSYKQKYFFSQRIRLNDEYYWLTYILDPVDSGKRIDLYAMDPGDVVKLAKLQEITSKIRDIEDSDNEYYLFAPKKRDYKTIISDSIFTRMTSYRKISSQE